MSSITTIPLHVHQTTILRGNIWLFNYELKFTPSLILIKQPPDSGGRMFSLGSLGVRRPDIGCPSCRPDIYMLGPAEYENLIGAHSP